MYEYFRDKNYEHCKSKYYSHRKDEKCYYHAEKEKSKHHKQISVGNPIINVHVDGDKENSHSHTECECSATIRFINSSDIVNICHNCQVENSIIVLGVGGGRTLRSTSIKPPDCYTDSRGTHVVVTGTAQVVGSGEVSEGIFNYVITERPGAFDQEIFTFIYSGGGSITSSGFPFDANLSVSRCKSHKCSCNSFHSSSIPLNSTFADEILNGKRFTYSDGQFKFLDEK